MYIIQQKVNGRKLNLKMYNIAKEELLRKEKEEETTRQLNLRK